MSHLPPLLQLPQDALEQIAFHLPAPDLLSFLSAHRILQDSLGEKAAFWRNLLWQREGASSSSSSSSSSLSSPLFYNNDMQQQQQQHQEDNNAKALKEQFLRAAYCQRLSNIQWRAIGATRSAPSEREGHGCLLLGEDDNLLVVTGGFTSDRRVYIKDLHGNNDDWHPINPTIIYMPGLQPIHAVPLFAYGASLTRLNATTAVRFGGFTSGGYARETSVVAILTITTNTDDRTTDRFQVTWRVVPQKFAANEQENAELNRFGSLILGRAYHTATLLYNRYLYIVGGMKTGSSSVLDPICLDCETWIWILYNNNNGAAATPTTTTPNHDRTLINTTTITAPSGRHGHSVVWDKFRNRLVLFGGGNGSDLLRSGRDNSEVWEFKNTTTTTATTENASAAAAFPSSSLTSSTGTTTTTTTTPSPDSFLAKIKSAQWRLIHQDQNQYFPNSTPIGHDEDMHQGGGANARNNNNRLRPAETLNLGRCHAAHHVARDTVILLFGSGKPSTNSILGYDLRTDSFFRPKLRAAAHGAAAAASSPLLPCPRFTFGSAFIPRLGSVFVHGGFSTQYSRSILDMALLDLTPIQRDVSFRHAAFGPALQYARSHAPVTDPHVLALRNREHRHHVHTFLVHEQAPPLHRPVFFPDQGDDEEEDDDDDDSS